LSKGVKVAEVAVGDFFQVLIVAAEPAAPFPMLLWMMSTPFERIFGRKRQPTDQ
jgi:hypothetical protein